MKSRGVKLNLDPLKKNKRIYQRIVDQIQLYIEKGILRPGDQLPSERVLAEKLSVSRTSVKEATSVLEASGIVEVKQGVGVFLVNDRTQDMLNRITSIVQYKRKDLIDLLELREAIECDAAYYAAIRYNDEDKHLLQQTFLKLKEAYNNGLIGANEDYEFHMSILKASKNQLMVHMMELISKQLLEIVTINREDTIATFGDTAEVFNEHENIYKFILARNPESARRAMSEHLEATRNRHYKKDGDNK